MPKAYSYIRFSSNIQQKGDSLRRQTQLREKYLKEHPELELDTSLKMTDLGVSAYDQSNIKKGNLGRFLETIKQGKVEEGSYLLVESLDRLSRAQVMEALEVFLGILNAGINIVSLNENIVYSRNGLNTDATNLIASILEMSRATEESAVKSKRLRFAWDGKRENISNKRLTARCPQWMKPSASQVGFVLIPERVAVVKRIFQMAKEGIGNGTITKRLNEEGVKTFTDKTDGWRESYIQKVLRSKSIYGEFQMHLQRGGVITAVSEPIENYYPSILSKEEWLLVNSLRAERRTRGGVRKGKNISNLFSGLLHCSYCRGPMVMGGHVNKKSDGTRRESKYVYCSRARRGLGCKFSMWDYSNLEDNLIKFCKSLDFKTLLNKSSSSESHLENAQKKVISLELEIQQLNTNMTKLLNAIENSEDAIPKSILGRINELESSIDELKSEKESAEGNVARIASSLAQQSEQQNTIVELLNRLQNCTDSELHDLRVGLSEKLRTSISKIYLSPCGPWMSENDKTIQRKLLKKAGVTSKKIDEYQSDLAKNATKENKSFFIMFTNGETISVFADSVSHNFKTMPQIEYLDPSYSTDSLTTEAIEDILKSFNHS